MKTDNPVNPSLQLSPWQHHARQWMSAALLFSDLFSLALAGTLAIAARLCLGQGWHGELYAQIIPVIVVCLASYTFSQLYPGLALSPVEELRRLSIITSIVVFALAGLTFFMHIANIYSRLTLGLTWLFSLLLLPLGRNLLRTMAGRLNLWGEPALLIGYGARGQSLAAELRQKRVPGYVPIVALNGFAPTETIQVDDGLPVISAAQNWEQHPLVKQIKTAIVILSETPDTLVEKVTIHNIGNFRRVILIPDKGWLVSLGVTPVIMDTIIGFKLHNNLLSSLANLQKRVIDIAGTLLGLLIGAPFFGLIGVLITLTSPGPVFYRQERVGKGGRNFGMFKFRTMHQDADQVLAEVLRQNPIKRAEWDHYQKLKDDPRVTKLGLFLRKYSIDEIPQLFNVLRGEMSLVGPRPFLPEQQAMYGEAASHYVRVLPGLTGLWQVTERNQSEFTRRAYWDEYYVRNWSLWLDVYILAKTVWVVLRRNGAY